MSTGDALATMFDGGDLPGIPQRDLPDDVTERSLWLVLSAAIGWELAQSFPVSPTWVVEHDGLVYLGWGFVYEIPGDEWASLKRLWHEGADGDPDVIAASAALPDLPWSEIEQGDSGAAWSEYDIERLMESRWGIPSTAELEARRYTTCHCGKPGFLDRSQDLFFHGDGSNSERCQRLAVRGEARYVPDPLGNGGTPAPSQPAETLSGEIRAESEPSDGAPFIDWPAFWSREHKGEDFLADQVLPRGRGVAMYARAKTGKSLLALEIAVALATGRTWGHRLRHTPLRKPRRPTMVPGARRRAATLATPSAQRR